MGNFSTAVALVLLIANCYFYTGAQSTVNVVPGIFSKKTESYGLNLPATSTFQPITTLTTLIHLDKPYSVFVHYQITVYSGVLSNEDFNTKLLINYANAGSLVHSGNQYYKTATGFYMANLNPGLYTFEVHYKSPVPITVLSSWDWQTAILQVIWFDDARAVSDGIKCYPTPTTTNTYNNWGSITDVEAVLQLPNDRVVLSAYQLSTNMTSPNYMVTSLEVDGFQQNTANLMKGNNSFLDLHGAWARNLYTGLHYFNIQYRTPVGLSFTDCIEKYTNNKNLYAMMLPPSCSAYSIRPESSFSLDNTNIWAPTDVTYSFTLTKESHVIIMYQYAGTGDYSQVVMCLSIDSVAQKHSTSIAGETVFASNFGLWQGPLSSGSHEVTLDYRSPVATTNTVSSDLEWTRWNKWMNRAMTVIIC